MDERWRITNPPDLLKFSIRDKDNTDNFYVVEKSLFGEIPLSVIVYLFKESPNLSVDDLIVAAKEVKPSSNFVKDGNGFICITYRYIDSTNLPPSIRICNALNELMVGGKYLYTISKVIAHLRDSVFITKM